MRLMLAALCALIVSACEQGAKYVDPTTFEYKVVSEEELLTGAPTLAPGGDAEAFLGQYFDWMFRPDASIQLDLMMIAAETRAPGADGQKALEGLVAKGHKNARFFQGVFTGGIDAQSGDDQLKALAKEGHEPAKWALAMKHLDDSSAKERPKILKEMRRYGDKWSMPQDALGDYLMREGNAKEQKEGVWRWASVHRKLTFNAMARDADRMLGVEDGEGSKALGVARKMYAAAIAWEPFASVMADTYAGDRPAHLHVRVALARLLKDGKGGEKDVDGATKLICEAVQIAGAQAGDGPGNPDVGAAVDMLAEIDLSKCETT